METKKLTKKQLRKIIKGGKSLGAHIRCRVVVDADDAFSQDRIDRLGDKLANCIRLEINNTLYGEYMGLGVEVEERSGITTALKILGLKAEYYEEGSEVYVR